MLPSLSLNEAQRSAVRLVRHFLQQHPRLSTQELFKLGVGETKPVLPADHAITNEGKLRMKKVSNMREGSRLWIPPPTAPYPGHPFRSVHYFKKEILHQLEAAGLIRMVEFRVPIEDEAGREVAIRKARNYTKRREAAAQRRANKEQRPRNPDPVEEVAPKFYTKKYAWVLGDSAEPDSRWNPIPAPGNADLAWSAAEELERRRLLAEAEEAERIAERKERRKTRYKEEGEAYKAERSRLMEAGLWEQFLANKVKEARREEAIGQVRKYAEQTGEDVSAWFNELGVRDRRSIFGQGRMQSQDEQDDLAMERYRQEQAAMVEEERERERNGGRSVARPISAHPDESDEPSFFGLKSHPRGYPVDWAWQEQLKAKVSPDTDSPFILKSASGTSSASESTPPRTSTEQASRLNDDRRSDFASPPFSRTASGPPNVPPRDFRMSHDQRAQGDERLQWSRASASRNSGRSKGFGLR